MPAKNPLLPSNTPWTPMAGIAFVALLLLLSGLGGVMHFIFGAGWGLGAQMLLSHGGVFVAILIFVYIKSGKLSRLGRFCALHAVSPVALAKAAAAPALLTAVGIYGWVLLHAHLRERLGYSMVEQPQMRLLRERVLVSSGYELYVTVFMIVIMAPVVEEFLFRMMLYFPIRQRIGVPCAAMIVSFFFAVLHVYPAGSGMEFIMSALLITGHLFILSIFFTVLLERTRTLLAPILGHVVYNGLVVALVLYGLAGL